MKKSTKVILLVIIGVFIAGMAFYPSIKKAFFTKEEKSPRENSGSGKRKGFEGGRGGKGNTLSVNVAVVQPEVLTEYFKNTATLIPDEEVDLTFESSGKIIQIFFKEGTSVRKGDLLAKVNDKPLQAELQKLKAQIPLAEDRVFRQKSLLDKDAVSKEAYEQVTTELEKLKADIELTKAKITQTELRAPFDGVIGLRLVSEGAFVTPTTNVAKLTKIVPLKIEFSVSQQHVNKIHPGTKISFSIDENRSYDALIYAVESKIDLNTRTLKARATYPNPGGILKPGDFASVEIKFNEIKNAITAPNEAVIAEMGRDIAYLYKGGKAKQIVLTKGLRTESKVQILQGLSKGDTLIVTGVMQLRDGIPVKIEKLLGDTK